VTTPEPETETPVEPEPEPGEPEPAEPEPAEPEPGEPEPEEPEPEEPQARAPTAKELRAFETENTRHEKRLGEIMGDDFAHFEACATCGGVGFTPRAPEELLAFVQAPGVAECPACEGEGGTPCPTCAGKGGLEYPTKVEGQRFQSCPGCGGSGKLVCVECAGNGWRREEPHPAALPAIAAPTQPNGGYRPPPGHVLVKIDPTAPDVPLAQPAQPVAAPVYAP
jgi:hypothetical protein